MLLTVLVLSCFSQTRADDARSLTLGVFAYGPVEQMQRLWNPVAQFLENALGDHQVELRVLNQEELAQAIRSGELDLVFTNPTHYIRLRAENHLSGAIATQVMIENGQPVSELGGVAIRRKDRTDIARLEVLAGKQVAIPGREYLGGYITQAMLLKERGMRQADVALYRFKEQGRNCYTLFQG